MELHKRLPAVSYISKIQYIIYIHFENICQKNTHKKKLEVNVDIVVWYWYFIFIEW